MYDEEPLKGRAALFHKPRATVEQKERRDLEAAAAHFADCGWGTPLPVGTTGGTTGGTAAAGSCVQDAAAWEGTETLFNALLNRAVQICTARSEEIVRGVTSRLATEGPM